MEREELGSWLRLMLTPGVGNEAIRKLMATFGLPCAVLAQSPTALRQVLSPAKVAALQVVPPEWAAQLERTRVWLQETGEGSTQRHIVVMGDPEYPVSLLTIEDPPLMLYLLGAGKFIPEQPLGGAAPDIPALFSIANNLTGSLTQSIAIVGSRNPTPQGAVNARHFAKAMGEAGLTVVSGLALGVDAAAHEGALDSVKPYDAWLATVAVVGTGLDRVYPKENRELAHRIAQHGLLMSEYPLGTPPLAHNFPRRNRLIAGLAQGTLVVEAALKSGSLITAQLTADQGQEVLTGPQNVVGIVMIAPIAEWAIHLARHDL